MNLKKSSLFSLERWITAAGGAQKQELEKFGKSLNLKAQLVSPLVKVPPTLVMYIIWSYLILFIYNKYKGATKKTMTTRLVSLYLLSKYEIDELPMLSNFYAPEQLKTVLYFIFILSISFFITHFIHLILYYPGPQS